MAVPHFSGAELERIGVTLRRKEQKSYATNRAWTNTAVGTAFELIGTFSVLVLITIGALALRLLLAWPSGLSY